MVQFLYPRIRYISRYPGILAFKALTVYMFSHYNTTNKFFKLSENFNLGSVKEKWRC